jgi:hypothetical protein
MRGFFGSKALGLVFLAAYLAGDTCPLRVPDSVWPRLPPRISLKTERPSPVAFKSPSQVAHPVIGYRSSVKRHSSARPSVFENVGLFYAAQGYFFMKKQHHLDIWKFPGFVLTKFLAMLRFEFNTKRTDTATCCASTGGR